MAESKRIPVRLPPETIQRLDTAAEALGNTRTGIVRHLLEEWLAGAEAQEARILGKEWDGVIRDFDGRRIEPMEGTGDVAGGRVATPRRGKKAVQRK